MQTIAVTGGGGFFGRALEPQLAARARLRGLFRTRAPIADAWVAKGHEVVIGDLETESALEELVAGVDVVCHCAARIDKSDPAACRRVNVEGTERLARAAKAAGVQRLVYVSSISVYAATRTDNGVVTEDVVPQHVEKLNPYSATKYDGELAVRRLADAGAGPPFTIVRPTNVYGPWGRSWFLNWARRLQRVPVVMGGDIPIDLVHVDDVAAALVLACESAAADGEVFHIGHEVVELGEFEVLIGRAIGRRVRRLPGGLDFVLRAVQEAVYPWVQGGSRSPSLLRPLRTPHDKAVRAIGYAPKVDLETGLERVGRWYRDTWLPAAG
jgi:nucleoside-diphosphate-sugar epimerase